MSEEAVWRIGAGALMAWGVKLILFGGTKTTGSYIEIFGFEFGTGEREPMGLFERWFIGLVCLAIGACVFKSL